jgi:transcription elongation GreA/GreB family factor
MITKRTIVQQIIKQLGSQLENLAGAARTMHADASDEQNKAEDKYDTRGLETAYLASSQARLATETEEALAAYQTLPLRKFSSTDPIDLTALVELETRDVRSFYFIGPCSGGLEIHHKATEILVITPESPMCQQLAGKKAGDRIKLQTRGPAQELKIISVQ